MRTIKFRVWDKSQKEFIPGDSINIAHDGSWCDFDYWKNGKYIKSELSLPEEGELNQFTGLLDSKGKEIYEHDIIQLSSKGVETSFPLIIRYFEPFARFMLHHNMGEIKFINDFDKDFAQINYENKEVIGNIYENSDFLR